MRRMPHNRFSRHVPLRLFWALCGLLLVVWVRWAYEDARRPPLPTPDTVAVAPGPPAPDPVEPEEHDWPFAPDAPGTSPFDSRFFESLLV